MSDLDYLHELPRFADSGAPAVKPGFDRIRALLEGLDHPEREYLIALVAGTNGKGSVASFTASICTVLGYWTGLHTSPHLFSIGERMRVNGKDASDWSLNVLAASMRELVMDVKPSFFEATLAMSLAAFREDEVDMAVIEVGLGGRLDASNVLDADVSVITSIGLDHTDLLGDTIKAIASEKAGIIKEGKPVVVGPLPDVARRVVEAEAWARNAQVVEPARWTGPGSIRTPAGTYSGIELGLGGTHQRTNFATALRTAELMHALEMESWAEPSRNRELLDLECVQVGASQVRKYSGLRARLEVLSTNPFTVVDVAHNPEGVEASLRGFMDMVPDASSGCVAVVGLFKDKDAQGVGSAFAKLDVPVICVTTTGGRGRNAQDLAQAFRDAGCRVLQTARDVPQALTSARKTGKSLLIVGSHAIAAEAISAHASSRIEE